jgi:hypothetical protein
MEETTTGLRRCEGEDMDLRTEADMDLVEVVEDMDRRQEERTAPQVG